MRCGRMKHEGASMGGSGGKGGGGQGGSPTPRRLFLPRSFREVGTWAYRTRREEGNEAATQSPKSTRLLPICMLEVRRKFLYVWLCGSSVTNRVLQQELFEQPCPL